MNKKTNSRPNTPAVAVFSPLTTNSAHSAACAGDSRPFAGAGSTRLLCVYLHRALLAGPLADTISCAVLMVRRDAITHLGGAGRRLHTVVDNGADT